MRHTAPVLLVLALLACNGGDDTGQGMDDTGFACSDGPKITLYTDSDGDGYGNAAAEVQACPCLLYTSPSPRDS